MKSLFIGTLLLFLSVALEAQVTHLKFTQDGEFANLSESTSPNASFSVAVARSTTNGVTTANINFTSTSVASNFSTITFVQIVGAIPAADFTGQNTQSLALSFNTSDLDPSGISQTCTLDLVTFNFTCTAGPTGTITLQFRQTGTLSTQILFSEVQTIGAVTTRLHQRSDNSNATATGTVLGTSVLGGNATVGINHSSTLEAIR